MSATQVEKRLTAIERDLAGIKAQRASTTKPHPIHTLEKIHGAFENDEAFQEAVRFGRQWRESQRAISRKSKAKRK